MAQTIDFYIDVGNGQLMAAGSGSTGSLPNFTRNDVYTFRVRLQDRDSNGFLRDIDTASTVVKIGVGSLDQGPSTGAFKLVLNSVTSSAITYNSDETTLASSIYTAVSNNVSAAIPFGSEPDAFILTATQSNTALSFGADAFTLFPTSSVLISTRRFPAASVQAQQILKLRRSPAVYADNFVASSTAGVISLTKKQDGGPSVNETYLLNIGRDAEAGGFVFNYGSNSTTAIAIGATAASFVEALSAVTGIGANNISVDVGNNGGDYTIAFVRDLGSTNITTALTLDASNVVFAKFLQSTVTFATAELDELFADTSTTTITPTLEIEISESGQPKTVYQGSITVRKDLITTGSVVPAAQAGYYTKAETDSLFVKDSTANVSASDRHLYDSTPALSLDWSNRGLTDTSETSSVDWENRQLISSNGTSKMFEWGGQGIAFFGVTTKSQVTQGSAVSALVNYGLLASSTTYGALPLSIKTLTTTSSITFGSVSNNSTAAVTRTVTGASINDIVLLGLPASVCQGLSFFGHVTTADLVEIDAVNATNGSIVQSGQTYRITIIGY